MYILHGIQKEKAVSNLIWNLQNGQQLQLSAQAGKLSFFKRENDGQEAAAPGGNGAYTHLDILTACL